jgi:hypothetical protein
VIAWGSIRLVAKSVAKTRHAKGNARRRKCPANRTGGRFFVFNNVVNNIEHLASDASN